MNTVLQKKLFAVSILLLIVAGCQKPGTPDNPQPAANELLIKVYDSANAAINDTFYYNADKQLTKVRSRGSLIYCDTFLYSNGLLTHSQYNGGDTIRFLTPYAQTDYVFAGNKLVSSNFYLGTTQITNSAYTLDTAGRISTVTQTMINYSPGVVGKYTARFEYDAASNLRKIYYLEAPNAEYLVTEFLNYDAKPNPFYLQPLPFDYNFYIEVVSHVSKNNPGKVVHYSSSGSSTYDDYRYEYDAKGRVSKREIKVSNGTSSLGVKYFVYK